MLGKVSAASVGGRKTVKNLLAKWASSENILSEGYSVSGTETAITQTREDEVVFSATSIATRGLRIPLDNVGNWDNTTSGDFTISFDLATDIPGAFIVRPHDAVNAYQPAAGEVSFVPIADSITRRYSVTLSSANGTFGALVGFLLGYVTAPVGYIRVSKIMIENVTGQTNKNPSTYVPNSVSKQLNSYFHQTDLTVPTAPLTEGCQTINDGFCWGSTGVWKIENNAAVSLALGRSFHSKQNTIHGRTYEYRITVIDGDSLFGPTVVGNGLSAISAGSTVTGRLIGNASSTPEVFVTTSGAPPMKFSEVVIIECDEHTNVDGVAFRDEMNELHVDPATGLVS